MFNFNKYNVYLNLRYNLVQFEKILFKKQVFLKSLEK